MYSRILVPVDLNNEDQPGKALNLAEQIARHNDAEMICVDVVDAAPTVCAFTEGHRVDDHLKNFAEKQAKRYGFKTTGEITMRSDLCLNVGSDIFRTANETNCDLIVMAIHMPDFKEHFFLHMQVALPPTPRCVFM